MKLSGLFSGLLTTGLAIAMFVWGSIFFVNVDPVWFLRSFNAPADEIRILWDGQETVLHPGDPNYEAVMAAFGDGVGHWAGYDTEAVLSGETLTQLRDEWRLLEVRFNMPVQVHTSHRFARAKFFFVPISGAHSQERRVFGSLTEIPKRSGALVLDEARYQYLVEAVVRAVGNP